MKNNKLKELSATWKDATYRVLDLKEIHLSALQHLLKETYSVLLVFHKSESIPKEICKIFLEIKDFLYFASLMEENELGIDYYCYRRIDAIAKALEKGFFCGDYGCDFPNLTIVDDYNKAYVFDFEENSLKDIII